MTRRVKQKEPAATTQVYHFPILSREEPILIDRGHAPIERVKPRTVDPPCRRYQVTGISKMA
jgi:hypothetical protein